MTNLSLVAALDPHFAAVLIFAMLVLFCLVMVYYMTLAKKPKLLTDFLSLIHKLVDGVLALIQGVK